MLTIDRDTAGGVKHGRVTTAVPRPLDSPA
jgi:hypothetical protein